MADDSPSRECHTKADPTLDTVTTGSFPSRLT